MTKKVSKHVHRHRICNQIDQKTRKYLYIFFFPSFSFVCEKNRIILKWQWACQLTHNVNTLKKSIVQLFYWFTFMQLQCWTIVIPFIYLFRYGLVGPWRVSRWRCTWHAINFKKKNQIKIVECIRYTIWLHKLVRIYWLVLVTRYELCSKIHEKKHK